MNWTPETRQTLLRLGMEIGIYALLVVGYLFVIVNLLGTELTVLFRRDPVLYAALALALMVFQGIFLESLTTFLIDRLEL